eukprot:1361406-Prymnesium_polylepis.3
MISALGARQVAIQPSSVRREAQSKDSLQELEEVRHVADRARLHDALDAVAAAHHIIFVENMMALTLNHAAHKEGRGEARFRERARVPVGALEVDDRGHLVTPGVEWAPLAFDKQLQRVVTRPTVRDAELALRQGLRLGSSEGHRRDAIRPCEANVSEVVARLELHFEGHVRVGGVRPGRVVRLAPAHATEKRRHIEAQRFQGHL